MSKQPQHASLAATLQPPAPPPDSGVNTQSSSMEDLHTSRTNGAPLQDASSWLNQSQAFYKQSSTYSPSEHVKTGPYLQPSYVPVAASDVDLEAGDSKLSPATTVVYQLDEYKSARVSISANKSCNASKEKGFNVNARSCESVDAVWPSIDELKKKAKAEKRERQRRNWNCLSGLTKKQRMWVQILIGLIIVCGAIGIGIGVSKAVGGKVYSPNGGAKVIPDSS